MIPKEIITEDGRKPMTPEWLAARLAKEGSWPVYRRRYRDGTIPSPHELCSWLGIVGDSWGELLRAGFPYPCTVVVMRRWFADRGWLPAKRK